MGYISAEGLMNMKTHKYQTTGYTWLDNHLFAPFWEWGTSLFPMWFAPNLITIVGLLFILAGYAIMLPFDHTFCKQLPPPILYFAAFCQFMYQTLDAIDGKQARRTGSSSPLGMLIDHGCDSLSSTFILMMLGQAIGLGHESNTLILIAGFHVVFYFATWEEYHTHYCRTKMGDFYGITENQLLSMGLVIGGGVIGVKGYQATTVSLLGFTLDSTEVILLGVVSAGGFSICVMFISSLLKATSRIMAICRLLPLAMLLGNYYLFRFHTEIYHYYPNACILSCGLLFSQVVGKIIICSITKMFFTPLHWEAFAFYVFFANSIYFKLVSEELAFTVLFTVIASSYLLFNISIVSQIADYLGIKVFTIKPKAS